MADTNGNPGNGAAGAGGALFDDDDNRNLTSNNQKKKAAKSATVGAILELLAERWPRCFSILEQRRKPLKVGIHLDIIAALGDAITPAELSTALSCYVANERYLKAVARQGARRISLDGEPVGPVSEEERTYARIKLDELWRASRQVRS